MPEPMNQHTLSKRIIDEGMMSLKEKRYGGLKTTEDKLKYIREFHGSLKASTELEGEACEISDCVLEICDRFERRGDTIRGVLKELKKLKD